MVSPELLRRFPLFAGQSHYMLGEIAMLSNQIAVKEDDWIFQENEEATKLYLILEGQVSLTMYLFFNGSGQHLKTTSPLTQGELFGWSAVVVPHNYKMGARAEADSKLLVIDGAGLRELFDDNPEFGYPFVKKISEEISERLELKCVQLLSLILDKKTPEKVKPK
jgi:CRP-like cAMP-binding protein